MPSAKEVRARQNRQKERIAIALAERQKVQRRRRRWGAGAVAVLIVVGLTLAILESGNNGGSKVAVTPPTTVAATTTPSTATPTTTKPLASVKGKPCVGLKSTLPKGSPAMFIAPGPAPTKLRINDIKVGTGAVVPKNGTVTVNYVGVACSNGEIFDSSYSRNEPLQADLSSGLITGWEQGIPGMRIGGVRELAIPSALAYGAAGRPPIAPDEALFFLISAVKLG